MSKKGRGYGANVKVDRDICFYCGRSLDDYNRTVDHLIPKSRGGIRSNDNKVYSCVECNRLKGDMNPAELANAIRAHISFMRRDARIREGYYRKILLNVEKIEKSREQR